MRCVYFVVTTGFQAGLDLGHGTAYSAWETWYDIVETRVIMHNISDQAQGAAMCCWVHLPPAICTCCTTTSTTTTHTLHHALHATNAVALANTPETQPQPQHGCTTRAILHPHGQSRLLAPLCQTGTATHPRPSTASSPGATTPQPNPLLVKNSPSTNPAHRAPDPQHGA